MTSQPTSNLQSALRVFAASWFIFLLSGCAASDAGPTTKAASEKVQTAASTAGMMRVPLILTGQNSALVEMKVNGKDIVLLLDTGAQGTVIDLASMTAIGVKSSDVSGFSQGVGAGKVAMRQAEVITLDMAGFQAHVAPSLQDFSALIRNWRARGGKPIIGLLGYDVLHAYGAIIDLNEGAMYLRKRI